MAHDGTIEAVGRRSLPGPPIPPHPVPAGPDLTTVADPATAAALHALRRRIRRPVRWLLLGMPILGWNLWVATQLALPDGLLGLLRAAMLLDLLALFAAIVSLPVRRRPLRGARRITAGGSWQLVECVRVPGSPETASVSAVVVLDPTTGQPAASWLFEEGRGPRWLPPDDRRWAYLAVGSDGRRAVLADLHRRRLAVLRARAELGSGDPHGWAWRQAAERWDLGPPDAAAPVPLPRPEQVVGTTPASPDRTHRLTDRQWWLFAVVIVVIVAVASAALVQRSRDADDLDALVRATGRRSEAVVASADRRGGRGEIEVLVTSGPARGWQVPTRLRSIGSLEPGDRVTVAYFTDATGEPFDLVVLGHPADTSDLTPVALVGGLALVVVGLAVDAPRRRRKAEAWEAAHPGVPMPTGPILRAFEVLDGRRRPAWAERR